MVYFVDMVKSTGFKALWRAKREKVIYVDTDMEFEAP